MEARWWSDRTAIVATVLFVVSCAIAYGGLFSHAYPGDAGTYADYGRALVKHGRIPYRDFYDEYPPGSVGVFALPALIWNAHYVLVFKLLMTACGVGLTLCSVWLVRTLELSRWRLIPVVAAPALLGPVFLNRYDPVPALLTVLGLIALLRARERTAGALLGVATAVKVYALAAVPVAARRIRRPRDAVVAFIAAFAVLVLPFTALGPGGVRFSTWTQLKRHLQIESLGASVLLVGSKLGIHHARWISGAPGSVDLGGQLADGIGIASSLLAIALALYVAYVYWHGIDDDARLVTAFAASITAFTVFGKVLSPQYLTWLVPLVPFAVGRKGAYAAGAFLVSLALTQPEYIVDKWGLRHQNWTVWALTARNAALVVAFVFLVLQLRESARRA